MRIECLVVGAFESNCYLVMDETSKKGLIIDPGAEPERIYETVIKQQMDVEAIVLTHGHPDHVTAASQLKQSTGARVLIHQADMEILNNETLKQLLGIPVIQIIQPDEYLKAGDLIEATNMKFEVVHTPGHTQGSICLAGEGVLFTGDLLFSGGIGRYDLPGGNGKEIMQSLEKVTKYPDETRIYPGHGPSSTLGAERRGNFYLINLFK